MAKQCCPSLSMLSHSGFTGAFFACSTLCALHVLTMDNPFDLCICMQNLVQISNVCRTLFPVADSMTVRPWVLDAIWHDLDIIDHKV